MKGKNGYCFSAFDAVLGIRVYQGLNLLDAVFAPLGLFALCSAQAIDCRPSKWKRRKDRDDLASVLKILVDLIEVISGGRVPFVTDERAPMQNGRFLILRFLPFCCSIERSVILSLSIRPRRVLQQFDRALLHIGGVASGGPYDHGPCVKVLDKMPWQREGSSRAVCVPAGCPFVNFKKPEDADGCKMVPSIPSLPNVLYNESMLP